MPNFDQKLFMFPELLLSPEDSDLAGIHLYYNKETGYWRKGEQYIHHIILSRMGIIKPFHFYLADHKDRNRSNNRRNNLCWTDPTTSIQNSNKNAGVKNRNKTHCIRNHEYTIENTGYSSTEAAYGIGVRRFCKECRRLRSRGEI